MYDLYDDQNKLIPAVITPALRVAWSRLRCWHGDEVKIEVQSELAKDGSKVEVEIVSKTASASIDKIDGLTLNAGKAEKTYKIEWKDKNVPKGECEFLVKAKVPEHTLEAQSDALYVDLIAPLASF